MLAPRWIETGPTWLLIRPISANAGCAPSSVAPKAMAAAIANGLRTILPPKLSPVVPYHRHGGGKTLFGARVGGGRSRRGVARRLGRRRGFRQRRGARRARGRTAGRGGRGARHQRGQAW